MIQHQREISSIIISSIQYYHKYCDDCKIYHSETCTSAKYFRLIFTILVDVVLLSDSVIISIIAIITLMINCDMKFLLSPILSQFNNKLNLMAESPLKMYDTNI